MGGVQAGAADARAVHEGMPYSTPATLRCNSLLERLDQFV